MVKIKNMNKTLKKSLDDSILPQEALTALSEFSKRLRVLRKTADMTQSELAEKMRITTSAINKYESATNVFPSIEMLLKLSILFNVSTDYLLLGIKNEPNGDNTISGEVKNSSVVQANQNSVVANTETKLSSKANVLLEVYESLSDAAKRDLLIKALEFQAKEEASEAK